MQKQTKSLLEELEAIGQNRDLKHVIENRANNVITSAINLLELINKNFDTTKAEILEKKLLSAIKNREPNRFSKSIRKKDEEKSK
jgi:hypothetical protein